MKFIINCSNLYVGGGVQVTLSFLKELENMNINDEYHVLCSPIIYKHLSNVTNNRVTLYLKKEWEKIKNGKF